MSKQPSIADNIDVVTERLTEAAVAAGRSIDDINLIAVSKTKPVVDVAAAILAGQYHFGENYLQEAIDKITQLDDAGHQTRWHYIGSIQSNKTRDIAEYFDWVHTVSRTKVAMRLSEQRPSDAPALNVCIQVNISEEDSKSGVSVSDLPAMLGLVASLPKLRLRGLMAIPEPGSGEMSYKAMQALFNRYQAQFDLDTLSIGMSDDYPTAIKYGATHIRIGTAIFGRRQ